MNNTNAMPLPPEVAKRRSFFTRNELEELNILKQVRAIKRTSTFVQGISCNHNWALSNNKYTCYTCGAVCKRDPANGKIVDYELPIDDEELKNDR